MMVATEYLTITQILVAARDIDAEPLLESTRPFPSQASHTRRQALYNPSHRRVGDSIAASGTDMQLVQSEEVRGS